MKKKAIIISIKSYRLSKGEINLLSNKKPWGLILFKRNIRSFAQLMSLTKVIRKLTKDSKFPILIDEEGKNVSRLINIFHHDISQRFFGDTFILYPSLALIIYKKYINYLCNILKKLGININTVPVLDVLRKNTNKVIGNRSFSTNPDIISKLGRICVQQYKLNKIGTVIKHIPGHGCSTTDSHFKMPIVNLDIKNLNKVDFKPFMNNKSFFAMTAHILYKKIDKNNITTLSKKIISKIIRKKIGFKGILISDDISMKAMKFDLVTNAKKSLSAGCNVALYCAGNYHESLKLLEEIPYIDQFTIKKTTEFYKFLG
tara:strand:- start:82 stop:1026 length:945 start_codon:yes stop_codon:yes gene_type:complete